MLANQSMLATLAAPFNRLTNKKALFERAAVVPHLLERRKGSSLLLIFFSSSRTLIEVLPQIRSNNTQMDDPTITVGFEFAEFL